MDFFKAMTDSARRLVNDGLAIKGGDLAAAFEYARERSAAGPAVWAVICAEFGYKG
jgi:hypothetical protein